VNRIGDHARSKDRRALRSGASGPAREAGTKALRAAKLEVDPEYLLRLFVSGFTPRSQRAIDNLKNICERHLAGRYRIEVIDLYQSPGLAHDEQIIATPTLLKVRPFPARRVIGDLSQVDRVLHGLDIQ
jgi:circadian clock protein KaiB